MLNPQFKHSYRPQMHPATAWQRSLLLQNPNILATSSSAGKGESPVAKFLIAGGVAWMYEFGVGHYLEFLKIVKQTRPGSYWQLTKEITSQKGIWGIWDGFFPWGTVQALAKGAVFGWAHAVARNTLNPYAERGQISQGVAEVIAGGVGGGFQGLVLSPTLLLKTRVMTDPIFRNKMGMWETSLQSARVGMKVIKDEGLVALMKGAGTFSAKRVADWSTRFLFSVLIEDYVFKAGDPNKKLSYVEAMTASLGGGIMSAFVTLPIDVLVAQIQQASKAGQHVSVLTLFKEEFKAGGWERVAGFATRGFIARALHVGLTTALMKTAASAVYDMYKKM